jgi:hypothetical protein
MKRKRKELFRCVKNKIIGKEETERERSRGVHTGNGTAAMAS